MSDQPTDTGLDPAVLEFWKLLSSKHGALDDSMKRNIARHVAAYTKMSELEEALRETERYKELYQWDTTASIEKAKADLNSCHKIWEKTNTDPDDPLGVLWVMHMAQSGLDEIEKARQLAVARLQRRAIEADPLRALVMRLAYYFFWGTFVAISLAALSPQLTSSALSFLLIAVLATAGLTIGSAVRSWAIRKLNHFSARTK